MLPMTSAYESGHIPPVLLRHRLRIAREFAGYEQEELAELIGVSRKTIGNSELGRVKPRRITLRAWAFHCEVPLSWIEVGDELPHPQLGPPPSTTRADIAPIEIPQDARLLVVDADGTVIREVAPPPGLEPGTLRLPAAA
jgi:DNA-binding XRE family transcriptional regulator